MQDSEGRALWDMTWHKARSISSGLSPQLLVNSGLYNPQSQRPPANTHTPKGPTPQQPQQSPSHPSHSPSHPPQAQPQPPSPPQGSAPQGSAPQGVGSQGLGPQHQSQPSAGSDYSGPNLSNPPQGFSQPQQGFRLGESNPPQEVSNLPQGPNPFHDVASTPAQHGQPPYPNLQQPGYNPPGTSLNDQTNASNPSLLYGTQQAGSSHGSSISSASAYRSMQGQSGEPQMSTGQSNDDGQSHNQWGSHERQDHATSSTGFSDGSSSLAAGSSAHPNQDAAASGSSQVGAELPERRPELPPGVTERPELGKLSPPTRNYSFLAGGMKSEPSSHKLSALEERHATGVPVTADEAFNRALKVGWVFTCTEKIAQLHVPTRFWHCYYTLHVLCGRSSHRFHSIGLLS